MSASSPCGSVHHEGSFTARPLKRLPGSGERLESHVQPGAIKYAELLAAHDGDLCSHVRREMNEARWMAAADARSRLRLVGLVRRAPSL